MVSRALQDSVIVAGAAGGSTVAITARLPSLDVHAVVPRVDMAPKGGVVGIGAGFIRPAYATWRTCDPRRERHI